MWNIDRFSPKTGRHLDENSIARNIIERVTGAVKGIDNDHAYIHFGGLFTAYTKNTLEAGGVRHISFKTPINTKYVHYRNETVSTSADKVTIELYEDATVTAGTGTLKTPINHRRIAPHESMSLVRDGVTVTAEGTLIGQSFIGGGEGAGQNRAGQEISEKNEKVLKPDSMYVVKIINGSTTSNIIQCNPMWYEEDDA